MKIVFFDVDDLSRNYLEKQQICQGDVLLFDKSMEYLTPQEYEQAKDAEVISVFVHTALKLNKQSLDRYPKLRLLSTRSTGYDHIDLDYCRTRKIEAVNVPQYGEATVAEFAFGALLMLTRHIFKARTDMKNHTLHMQKYTGMDLYGRTIGIIGTGAIGRHAAKLAQGFGMQVLAYDPYPNEEFRRIYRIDYVSLHELYARADVISLHAPATKDNYHLLNDDAFSRMKDGVLLVNTARGSLVDAEALYRALASGKVGGAALDVLENEDFIISDDIILHPTDIPMEFAMNTIVNARLMQLPNVLITPHIAFNSVDAVHRILDSTIQSINAFCAGEARNSILHKTQP